MTNPTIPRFLKDSFDLYGARIALIDGDRSITYQQLASAVAVAAAHPAIAAHGAPDPPPVIVIAPLGIGGLVLQLGSLFAGRVCAPLETATPTSRLIPLIDSIGGPVVCLDDEVMSALVDAGVECVDHTTLRLAALLAAHPIELHPPDGDGDTAALLCFTSGSTGDPKGVLIPHSQLVEAAQFAGAVDDDVVGITSPPSFFASMLQSLTSLAFGGTGVYLDLMSRTGAQLHATALDVGLTQFTGSTTHVRELAAAAEAQPLLALRAIDLGGEPTTTDDIEEFRNVFPRARIRNIYGSSETGRITTLDIYPDDDVPPSGHISAGRTDGVLELLLVDDDDRPVPAGRVGRIAVHRPQPFLGYWRDHELTRSRVIDDVDRQWILSGDLGRIDVDGLLHVVGRTDALVKIRSRFVHPGDIDAILRNDPRIARVVTVAVPLDSPSRLHTIVVPRESDVAAIELHDTLRRSLPFFALPRHIILTDMIPVTDRGKPDRAALAQLPVPTEGPNHSPSSRDQTITEKMVLDVFCDVLAKDVGVDDDFFAVGGDSLAAIEVMAIMASEFGVPLTPARFTTEPTAAGIARLLEQRTLSTSPPGLLTLNESDHPTSIFWMLGGHNGFGPTRLAHRTTPVRSSSLRIVGSQPGERVLPSITAIGTHNANVIERNRTERTVLAGFSAGTVMALETARILTDRGTPPDLVILVDPPTREGSESKIRLPNPARHPFTFTRMIKRRFDYRRPFSGDRPVDIDSRLVMRHSLLISRHIVRDHHGPTAIIVTEHFDAAGGTPFFEGVIAPPISRMVITGNHWTALRDPGPLAAAINELLFRRGLT